MTDEAIPREELEAIFKDLKKRSEWSIMKIYDDGGVKLIDEFKQINDGFGHVIHKLGATGNPIVGPIG